MIEIILYSCLAGIIGTGLGGVLGIFFGTKTIGKTLSFTGGIMIGVVFFDLFPMTISISNVFISVISVLIGVILVCLIDSIIVSIESKNKQQNYLINTGIILLITMALHNFPEGMAIGSSGATDLQSGFLVSIVIALHDIPEGMAIATPLTGGKLSKYKTFFLTVLSGFSTILGAILGNWLGNISSFLNAICLGMAAGAMLYVCYGELLPDALETSTKKQSAILVIIGIIISLIILNLLK